MDKEEYIKRHKELHNSFNELLADYLHQTKNAIVETSLVMFLEWSCKQIINPPKKVDKEKKPK